MLLRSSTKEFFLNNDPSEGLEQVEKLRRFVKAKSKLKPKQREALEAHLQGYSEGEAATHLGIQIATFRSRLKTAKKMMHDLLDED